MDVFHEAFEEGRSDYVSDVALGSLLGNFYAGDKIQFVSKVYLEFVSATWVTHIIYKNFF